MTQASPQTDSERKAALHTRIDSMDGEQLTVLERALLRLEADRLVAEISAGFDEARRSGRMTDETIQAALAEHRAKHPYR